MRIIKGLAIAFTLMGSTAQAQDTEYLLFDAKTRQQFAGCLNCERIDDGSVCNPFGDYGSKSSEKSIWNRFGAFGAPAAENSPWNRSGHGLVVLDPKGHVYGRFSLNPATEPGQSDLPMVQSLLKLYQDGIGLDQIRYLLCQ